MARQLRFAVSGLFILFVAVLIFAKQTQLSPLADSQTPRSPQNLQVRLSTLTTSQVTPTHSVSLSWDAPLGETGQLYYRVQRCQLTGTACQFIRINRQSLTNTSYIDTGLSAGSYQYRVMAARRTRQGTFRQGPATQPVSLTVTDNVTASPPPTPDPDATADLFVSPLGNTQNSCQTAAEPCPTVAAALGKTSATLKRIQLLPGTYDGIALNNIGQSQTDQQAALTPISLIAADGVIIRPTSRGMNIVIENSKGVTLEGFVISNSVRNAIRVLDSSHITIKETKLDHCTDACILTARTNHLTIVNNITVQSVTSHGIYVSDSGDSIVIRGNTSQSNKSSGIQVNAERTPPEPGDGLSTNVLIENNVVSGNGNGLNLLGVQEATVQNNLLYGNTLTGIVNAKVAAAAGPKDVKIYHNTVVMPETGRYALQFSDSPANAHNIVRNNIFYHPAGKGRELVKSGDQQTDSDYNIYFGSTYSEPHSILTATLVQLFLDAQNNNYRLAGQSPAHNHGTLIPSVTRDIVGTGRPQGAGSLPAIGAFEN